MAASSEPRGLSCAAVKISSRTLKQANQMERVRPEGTVLLRTSTRRRYGDVRNQGQQPGLFDGPGDPPLVAGAVA